MENPELIQSEFVNQYYPIIMLLQWVFQVCLPIEFIWNVLFQVDKLSAEIHERKKKDKERIDSETQTEEYVWTETGVFISYVH